MANWENIKISAKRYARTAVKEAGEAAGLASLNFKLKALEMKRNNEYEMLGRLTYRQLKTGVSQAERIAPVIVNIDNLREKIAGVNEEIGAARIAREERRTQDRAERLEVVDVDVMDAELLYDENDDDDDDDYEE